MIAGNLSKSKGFEYGVAEASTGFLVASVSAIDCNAGSTDRS